MRDKYRIKFEKDGIMRFTGHLDLLKIIQRATKRAELPVAFSSGFNPHQQVSFALPLPIGMSSVGEYVDIEFDVKVPGNTILEELNKQMPVSGLRITSVREFAEGEKSGAALTEAASYEIILPVEKDAVNPKIVEDILKAEQIVIPKKTKSGVNDTDIRPDIFSLCLDGNILRATLAAGSSRSLKPELVAEYMLSLAGVEFGAFTIKYHRLDLLQKTENGFKSLNEV